MIRALPTVFDRTSARLFENRWSGPLVYLDWLRGLAAVAVLLQHCQQIFFVRHIDLVGLSPLLAAFYHFSTFGREAVMVFFVLSGFCISASIFRSFQRRQWSWSDYLLKRSTRLYIVLIPALLLGMFWDQLGMSLFVDTGIYQGTNPSTFEIPGKAITERTGLEYLLGNLLFVQGFATSPYGSNNPLWTLSYEFWYYLLFPCLLLACLSKLPLKQRALYGVAVLAMLAFTGKDVALYFLVWLLGAAVALARPLAAINTPTRVRRLVGGALVLFIATATLLHKLPSGHVFVVRDFLVAGSFAFLIYALLHMQSNRRQTRSEAMAQQLAGFSYTLYVVHYPPLIFLSAWLFSGGGWSPGYDQFGWLLGSMLGLLAYAWGLSRLTEAHTDRVRQQLSGWLSHRPWKTPRPS